uniref:Uncharacterized protein n=1 Tax=Arundo donax TaxID=35708 RepID=A0A0A8XP66_ARUDO
MTTGDTLLSIALSDHGAYGSSYPQAGFSALNPSPSAQCTIDCSSKICSAVPHPRTALISPQSCPVDV